MNGLGKLSERDVLENQLVALFDDNSRSVGDAISGLKEITESAAVRGFSTPVEWRINLTDNTGQLTELTGQDVSLFDAVNSMIGSLGNYNGIAASADAQAALSLRAAEVS